MNNTTIPEAGLFKLVLLVAGIVVAMFLATVLVALIFMPNPLIVNMLTDDIKFLLPLCLSTLCSAIVLGTYTRSHLNKTRKKSSSVSLG